MMSPGHNPQISVVMAVYNEPIEWMRIAIDSVLQQTYRNLEFIIINDNPLREENKVLLNGYSALDSRIVLISNDENIGLTKSLNKGLRIARGEYIARMDADDISEPERIEKQVNMLLAGMCDFSHSAYIQIDESGHIVKDVVHSNINYSDLFLQNIIAHPSVMFNRKLLLLRNSFYDESILRSQDYELWTFLFLHNVKFSYYKKPLIRYRVSDQQISTKSQTDQWRYSQISRSRFVYKFLRSVNITLDLSKTNQMLNLLKSLYNTSDDSQKSNISRVIYLLLYTNVAKDPIAILKLLHLNKYLKDISPEFMGYIYKAVFRRVKPFLIINEENNN